VQATDLGALASVSQPTIAPDASRVVVAVSHPDLAADADVGQLWNAPLDGTGARRLTRGFRDSSPAFSPDGTAIAFLRAEPGGGAQLHVMPALGGEPTKLTNAKLGVSDASWSPDSRRLAYLAAVPERGRHGTVEGISPAAEPPRRITGLDYKSNGVGYSADRRRPMPTARHRMPRSSPSPHSSHTATTTTPTRGS